MEVTDDNPLSWLAGAALAVLGLDKVEEAELT